MERAAIRPDIAEQVSTARTAVVTVQAAYITQQQSDAAAEQAVTALQARVTAKQVTALVQVTVKRVTVQAQVTAKLDMAQVQDSAKQVTVQAHQDIVLTASKAPKVLAAEHMVLAEAIMQPLLASALQALTARRASVKQQHSAQARRMVPLLAVLTAHSSVLGNSERRAM